MFQPYNFASKEIAWDSELTKKVLIHDIFAEAIKFPAVAAMLQTVTELAAKIYYHSYYTAVLAKLQAASTPDVAAIAATEATIAGLEAALGVEESVNPD